LSVPLGGVAYWWTSRETPPPDGFAFEYVFVSDNWAVADHILQDNGGEIAKGMECSHQEGIMATVRNEHGEIIGAEPQDLFGTVHEFLVSDGPLFESAENQTESTPAFECILQLHIPLTKYAEFYEIDPPFHHQTVVSHAEAVDRELLMTSQGPIPEDESLP
jgi:hypothetical protein